MAVSIDDTVTDQDIAELLREQPELDQIHEGSQKRYFLRMVVLNNRLRAENMARLEAECAEKRRLLTRLGLPYPENPEELPSIETLLHAILDKMNV